MARGSPVFTLLTSYEKVLATAFEALSREISKSARESVREKSCRETQFLLETRIKLLGHFYPERRKMENQSESNTLVDDDYGNPETDEPTGVFKASLFSS